MYIVIAMIKTQKIKGMGIEVPNTSAFNIETPPGLPKMHFNLVSCARRGSGKTVSIVNLLKKLQDAKVLDRIFIISPTIKSNKKILEMIKVDEDDIYDEPTAASLDAVIEKGNEEATDYDEYIEQMKIYKKYLRYMKTGRGTLRDEDIFDLYDGETQTIQPPKHKWNGKKPVMALFIDDAQGSPLFSVKSKIHNYTIKHRHLFELKGGGALGLSLIFAVQSFKSNANGIPRSVRGNCTHIMLHRTKDINELNDIADEFSGEVSRETFMKIYDYATSIDYGFLWIDLHKKKEDLSPYRRCFDEYIIIDEEKEKQKTFADNK